MSGKVDAVASRVQSAVTMKGVMLTFYVNIFFNEAYVKPVFSDA